MKILFYAICAAAVLYCLLFAIYCVRHRRACEAASLLVLGGLAGFAAAFLWTLA